MDLKKSLKTQGIYFVQSDARKKGYYTKDDEGNFKKNKYKVTLKDKVQYFLTNKKIMEPISTSYIYIINYNNELIVKSGSMSGDAVSVAKEVRTSFSNDKSIPYHINDSTLILDYGDATEELEFNEHGENISRKLINHSSFEVKIIKSYAFLNWFKV